MEQPEETLIPKRKIRIVHRPNLASWDLERIIIDYTPPTWKPVFDRTIEERKTIAGLIKTKVLPVYGEIYPLPENIYRAFELCPLDKVRVVIVGQDPYPQKRGKLPKAVGLSFSIAPDDPDIPGSLKNIYKELAIEFPDFKIPKHGDLRDWARQGVLLLNVALDIAPGEPANKNIARWKPFFIKTVRALTEYNPDVIFVLWGNKAQEATSPNIGNAKTFISGHPSPQAVNFGGNFIGNGHFKKINDLLDKMGQATIDWQI